MNGNAISSAALSREEYGESDAPSSQPSLLQRQLSTAESEQEGAAAPRRRRRRYPAVRINLEHCKYEVLRLAAKDLGWRRVEAYVSARHYPRSGVGGAGSVRRMCDGRLARRERTGTCVGWTPRWAWTES